MDQDQDQASGGRPSFLRRMLALLLSRYDILVVLVILAAIYVFVFRLHLVPLPGGGVIRDVACPSGPHAAHAAAPGCSRLGGSPAASPGG